MGSGLPSLRRSGASPVKSRINLFRLLKPPEILRVATISQNPLISRGVDDKAKTNGIRLIVGHKEHLKSLFTRDEHDLGRSASIRTILHGESLVTGTLVDAADSLDT